MNYSKEQLRAEMERRGLLTGAPNQIPPQQNNPRFSREQVMAEMQRRGITPKQDDNFLSKANSFATGFNRPIENTASGIIQLLSKLPGVNFGPQVQQFEEEKEREYAEHKQRNPLLTGGGKIAGNIGMMIPGLFAGGGTAAPLASQVLRGAGIGAAQGATQYVNPDDSRLKNAAIGGALGGLLPAGLAAAKGAVKLPGKAFELGKQYRAAHPEVLAPKILNKVKAAEETAHKEYSSFLKAHGKNKIEFKIPTRDSKDILKAASRKEREILGDYFKKSNTVEGAHDLQKELGRFGRSLEKTASKDPYQRDALSSIKDLRKALKDNIEGTLSKDKNPLVGKEHARLTKSYKENVVPGKTNKNIQKYREGEYLDEDFIKALKNDKSFRAKMKQEYPEFGKREIINNLGKGALFAGGITGAGKLGLLKHLLLGDY